MNYAPLILVLIFSSHLLAAENFCEALNLVNSDSIHKMTRRSSARSMPSTATASQFNPANVSHDRGVGVETMYAPGNSPTFSFVTGTGKAGAALISSNLENSFFGNRVPEVDADYLDRRIETKVYDSNKYTLGIGAALFKRKKFSLDIGVVGKYHENIKKLNSGAGLSARIGPVSLGSSFYKDDFLLKYSDGTTYQETFHVQTYSAGIQIQNLFLDAGIVKTRYKLYQDDQQIKIYSASYIYKKFLFKLAVRSEDSPLKKYDFKEKQLITEESDNQTYGSVQYSANKYIILGAHYNYYLLNELAFSLVIFI